MVLLAHGQVILLITKDLSVFWLCVHETCNPSLI